MWLGIAARSHACGVIQTRGCEMHECFCRLHPSTAMLDLVVLHVHFAGFQLHFSTFHLNNLVLDCLLRLPRQVRVLGNRRQSQTDYGQHKAPDEHRPARSRISLLDLRVLRKPEENQIRCCYL